MSSTFPNAVAALHHEALNAWRAKGEAAIRVAAEFDELADKIGAAERAALANVDGKNESERKLQLAEALAQDSFYRGLLNKRRLAKRQAQTLDLALALARERCRFARALLTAGAEDADAQVSLISQASLGRVSNPPASEGL